MMTAARLRLLLVAVSLLSVAHAARRGATVQTKGSIKVLHGRGNRAGNDEEELVLDRALELQEGQADLGDIAHQAPASVTECNLAYCNTYPDLQNGYCDAKTCDTEAQAAKCLEHWTTAGHKENNGKGRAGDPEACASRLPTPAPTPAPTPLDTNSLLDMTKCVSEGGDVQCGQCDIENTHSTTFGGLPCKFACVNRNSPNSDAHPAHHSGSACPHSGGDTQNDCSDGSDGCRPVYNTTFDSITAYPPNYFVCFFSGKCQLRDIGDTGTASSTAWLVNSVHTGAPLVTDNFPGVNGTVVTKILISHPPWAERNVGVLAVKRIVLHHSETENQTVADVYKNGLCVVCPSGVVPWQSSRPGHETDWVKCNNGSLNGTLNNGGRMPANYNCKQKANYVWWSRCLLKALTDTDSDGNIKDQYQCGDTLQGNASLTWDSKMSINNVQHTEPAGKAFEDFLVAF